MQSLTLTKEEFITRSMAGEVFLSVDHGTRFFYDSKETIPFRVEASPMGSAWETMNGKTLFTLEQPKPKIERRWKYRKDYPELTDETLAYYPDSQSERLLVDDWYKAEDCFIDIEIKVQQ